MSNNGEMLGPDLSIELHKFCLNVTKVAEIIVKIGAHLYNIYTAIKTNGVWGNWPHTLLM